MVKTTNGHPSIHPFFHVFDALRQDLQGRSLLQGTGARPWADVLGFIGTQVTPAIMMVYDGYIMVNDG